MKALGYFLLIPFSMIIYIALATGMGLYQRYPVLHFALMAVGLVLLFRLIRQKFSIWRLLLNIGAWTLTLFFMWWTLIFSSYPEMASPVAEAADVLSIKTPDASGEITTLNETMGDSDVLLLTFYRGFW